MTCSVSGAFYLFFIHGLFCRVFAFIKAGGVSLNRRKVPTSKKACMLVRTKSYSPTLKPRLLAENQEVSQSPIFWFISFSAKNLGK